MRILSLIPAATDIVYLLGLEKYLVGESSEIISSPISNTMTSLQIDMAVKKLGHTGIGVFHIDQEKLRELKPDLILTQELCEVCALTPSVILRSTFATLSVNSATKDLKIRKAKSGDSSRIARNDKLTLISLEPESVEDILENIRVVGEFGGKEKEAVGVIRELRERLEKVQKRLLPLNQVQGRNDAKPKVLVIEWLDPIMVAGHWVPEMIELAGGLNLLSKSGEKSKRVTLDQLKAAHPDILVISPCGFDIKRIIKEKRLIKKIVRGVGEIGEVRVVLVDGDAYITRPGPRIIDGIEILAEVLHPEVFKRKHSGKDWLLYESSLRGA